jgi:succinyl-CoA synthetase beta subunit
MVEINSLVVTHQNQLYALDTKMNIDDQSLFRHEEFAETCQPSDQNFAKKQARKFNINYFDFPGNLGFVVNGMGLAYLTLDKLTQENLIPGPIIDIQEGPSSGSIATMAELLFSDPKIYAVVVDVFGGMTRCDELAEGLLLAEGKNLQHKPVFIRLKGTNAEKGRKLLQSRETFSFYETTEDLMNSAIKYLRDLG